jgi:pimeloyl-ACP methyl ester carboxylesterase
VGTGSVSAGRRISVKTALLAVLAAILVNGKTGFAQGTDHTITVTAIPLWTDTGITLQPTDSVRIHDAAGRWNVNVDHPYTWAGPDGVPYGDTYNAWVADGRLGDLIGFIGATPYGVAEFDPQLFAIGSRSVSLSGKSGKLWLGFNDDYIEGVSDNGGSVTVVVTITTGSVLQLVDPVPSLVQDGAVISDTVLLSTLLPQAAVVKGVAADGVTQIVIQVSGAQPNDNLSFKIDADGGLANIGSTNFQSNISVQADSSGNAFALYRAPLDFVRTNNANDLSAQTRTVNLTVQSTGNQGTTSETTITVMRPPVVLIHGLWSSPSAWDHFCPNSPTVGLCPTPLDSRFKTFRVNYSGTAGEGFAVNAPLALAQVIDFIGDFKSAFQVAAVQMDAVAHSMGGNIVRQMVLIPGPIGFLRDNNYLQGDIRKLITIDTPHLGSEFATRLFSSSALCKAIFDQAGDPIGGAITDLVPNSSSLLALQQTVFPLQAHLLTGIASVTQEGTAEQNFRNLGLGLAKHVCSGLIPNGGFQTIFGGSNDLIVSQSSQAGSGLGFFGGTLRSDNVLNIIHTVIPSLLTQGSDALSRNILGNLIVGATTTNPDSVINLLNQPISSPAFGALRP